MSNQHNMQDYEEARASFHWKSAGPCNFAVDVVDHWAREPDRLALLHLDVDGVERRRTFGDFSRNSRKLCNVLESAGVKRGDVVLVLLGREIEWWEVFCACLRLGAIVAPGTLQLTSKDIAYRIEAAGASCVVTTAANAGNVDQALASCPGVRCRLVVGGARPGWTDYTAAIEAAAAEFEGPATHSDEPAICYFTSGTTGRPKMTVHTHGSYPFGHEVTGRFWLDLKPDDLHWNVSDTGWAKAAWSSLFGPWLCGTAIFAVGKGAFDPKETLDLLGRYPITTLCAAPTVYRMLVLEDLGRYRFASLRHCVAAGEPLNPEVIEIWREATGLTIRDGYGQTETVLLCGNFPCIEPRPGSMGKPSPGFEIAVIDDAGEPLPPGKEGDIAVRVKPQRPLGLFKEYWKDAERTSAVYRGDWYLTGDRAYVDADGYFWFVGRADDVIISAGYRIGPFEVESALLEHDAVAESAVVASPDETRGQVVKAFVVLAPGFEPSPELADELKAHVRAVTAPYKYPRLIEFIEALPKTVSGKIRRVELRNRELARGR